MIKYYIEHDSSITNDDYFIKGEGTCLVKSSGGKLYSYDTNQGFWESSLEVNKDSLEEITEGEAHKLILISKLRR